MNHLLISTLNNQIQVLDLFKDEEVVKFSGHTNSNHLVDLQIMEHDGNVYLLSGSEDGCFYMWNVEGGECLKIPIEEANCTMNGLTMNKRGIMATSGHSNNQTIRFLRIQ